MKHIIKFKLFESDLLIDDLKFKIDNKKSIFKLLLNDNLIAKSYFSMENPDNLFNNKYVGIFKLETIKEFRVKGYMNILIDHIFEYVLNNLNINYILLNVYKDNHAALNLYLKKGFEIYKDFNDDEYPYFTLIKRL